MGVFFKSISVRGTTPSCVFQIVAGYMRRWLRMERDGYHAAPNPSLLQLLRGIGRNRCARTASTMSQDRSDSRTYHLARRKPP